VPREQRPLACRSRQHPRSHGTDPRVVEQGQQRVEPARLSSAIGVEERHDGRGGRRQPGVAGRARPPVDLVTDPAGAVGMHDRQVRGLVRRRIVDHDDVVPGCRTIQSGQAANRSGRPYAGITTATSPPTARGTTTGWTKPRSISRSTAARSVGPEGTSPAGPAARNRLTRSRADADSRTTRHGEPPRIRRSPRHDEMRRSRTTRVPGGRPALARVSSRISSSSCAFRSARS
jgi:hypothetical protein